MKKILLFSISMLFCVSGFSQNYKCVKTDAISHFKSGYGYIASIRIDSVFNGLDYTDYVSYFMLRPLQNQQGFTTKGASWIGEKFRCYENGDNVFFNKYSDEIIIKNPELNTSWQLFRSDSMNVVLTAQVLIIQEEIFLGITDSVATIILSAKDTNGIIIQNNATNFALRLSKNHGLVNALNFYEFPFTVLNFDFSGYYPTNSLSLIGMDNPQIGWQNLTANDIFNWEIDWEMHSKRTFMNSFSNPSHTNSIEKTIHKIIDKSLANDSLRYAIERCYFKQMYNSEMSSDTLIFDTINIEFPLSQDLNKLSYEPVYNNNEVKIFIKQDSLIQLESRWIFSFNPSNNTCNGILTSGWNGYMWVKALGEEYYSDEQFDGYTNDRFMYYKKGNIEWGNPYFCESLEVETMDKNNFESVLYPNPTNNNCFIKIENPNNLVFEISLKDISNNTISNFRTTEFVNEINLEDVSPGIYFVEIKSKNETAFYKLIKL